MKWIRYVEVSTEKKEIVMLVMRAWNMNSTGRLQAHPAHQRC